MKKEKKNKQGLVRVRMQKKLVMVFILVFLSFVGLSWRLYAINRDSGGEYKKQVMSQQQVASRVLPFRRGDIVDRKGSKLAYSEKVYNLVVDAKLMHSEEGIHLEPTLRAMEQCFPSINMPKIREYVMENPGSRYKIFAKKLTLEEITPFKGIMDGTVSFNQAEDEGSVIGVWFEEDYQRRYPYGSLAGDVLGFVQGGNTGFFGLEEYYNDTLNGVNGRQYGYMNEDSVMEEKVRPAEDGNTIVSTIDTNIQSIVEKHIRIFAETHENEYREGPAADNIGVIVMNPNNGEVYAMAGYPVFDLNHPTDMSGIDLKWYMPKTPSANVLPQEPEEPGGDPEVGVEPHEATDPENTGISQNEPPKEEDNPEMLARNKIWRNFCISDSYEPGSVMKPFTLAGALDSGKITGDETYMCNGYLPVGGFNIHCHNRLGDGLLTVEQGLAKSCNVLHMDVAFAMGKDEWLRYNRIFNFGLKTNIDLAGEANASDLTFHEDMGQTDLAVASFGQGFNVTMIQMAAGFSALINGGYYYQPRVVSKILNSEGAVIEERDPRIYKQVISEATSAKMRQYLRAVVMSDRSECTGWSARPAGYTEGGKTGTAEKYPRKDRNYLISFMGFVPAENPQVLCYTVIDRPNTAAQSESTRLATVLNKDIMTEVLPYLNIFPTEPITESELADLEEKELNFSEGSTLISSNSVLIVDENGEPVFAGEGEEGLIEEGAEGMESEEGGEDGAIVIPEEKPLQRDSAGNVISENVIRYDPATGFPLDPATGEVLDPRTLLPIDTSRLLKRDAEEEGGEGEG